MNRFRPFAVLMFLAFLGASATPETDKGSGKAFLEDQVAPVLAPEGPVLGPLVRATGVGSIPPASRPVEDARREATSPRIEDISGGPTGALLTGAALLAAGALILAVLFPW
jgi:hypothetical protein